MRNFPGKRAAPEAARKGQRLYDKPHEQLSRRQRQIMDIIYRRGRANAAEVLRELPDPPSYSAVRAMLRILEANGQLRHEKVGPRYVYVPTHSRRKAGKSAIRRVVGTFFGGSTAAVMINLLESGELDADEVRKLRQMLNRKSKEAKS